LNYISDDLQALLQSTMDTADKFSNGSSEWLLVEHRLQSIREKFQLLFAKSNREHREIKVNYFLD
jgi:hypothetical protein